MSDPANPALRLVPIFEADLDQVAALVNRAFARYSNIFKGDRTSAQDYRDEAGEDARVILIEEYGKLLATGMVARAERFVEPEQLGPAGTARPGVAQAMAPEHPWSGAMYFGLAGVEPAIMNRGLGRMMVSYVERLARSEGFPRVGLGTLREFGLVKYYEKLDYRTFHMEDHPAGHWQLVVPHRYCEMVKEL